MQGVTVGGWEWSFGLVGLPLWIVLPMAAVAVLLVRRLMAAELASLPASLRRRLMLLRSTVTALFCLLLLEPTLSWRKIESVLPTLAVLLDESGSMQTVDRGLSPSERLAEAVVFGMRLDGRDAVFGEAADVLEQALRALTDLQSVETGAAAPGVGAAEDALREALARLQKLEPRLRGQVAISTTCQRIMVEIRNFAGGAIAGTGRETEAETHLRLSSVRQVVTDLIAQCRSAQEAADAAYLTSLNPASAEARQLEAQAGMSRHERALRVLREVIAPDLRNRARLRVLSLKDGLQPVSLDTDSAVLHGRTDFELPLRQLARESGDRHPAAVLLISDGRQTTGGDALPAVQALRAQGTLVHAVLVGSDRSPRDAVVGDIIGSREIYRGETVRLDVRFRITGFESIPWDLILMRNGEPVERRQVVGTGEWQVERFEFAAEEVGLMRVHARLVRIDGELVERSRRLGHWSFDSLREARVPDQTQHGRMLTVKSASVRTSLVEGCSGSALAFPDDSVVAIANPPIPLQKEWTIACWFRTPFPEQRTWRTLIRSFQKDYPVTADADLMLGTFVGGRFHPSGFWIRDLPVGWHFLVAVGEGDETRFYIDGLRVGASAARSDEDIYAVGNAPDGKQRFAEAIDELLVFDKAFSDEEVRLLHAWRPDPSAAEGLVREIWTGIEGSRVADLTAHPRFRQKPDRMETIGEFATAEGAERYGERMRGWLAPPASGSYRLFIAADDGAELWLSSSASPERRVLIASVPSWTAPGDYDRYPQQTSQPIMLQAGQRYYVEALHKEGTGGDHLSVGWERPDGCREAPLPSHVLRRLETDRPAGDEQFSARLEEASVDNNQVSAVVAVNEDPLRALLVDAWPRWESRYLVTLLERDRKVRFERRYRSVRLPRREVELLPLRQETLDAYDMLVLGDLRPGEITPEDERRIADFVGRRGGFLVILAGPRGMPAHYGLGHLADLLPVRLSGALGSGGGESADGEPVRLQLAEDGEAHPVCGVLSDRVLNRKLWPALPAINWVARGVSVKRNTQVLLRADDPAGTPVLVLMRFGAGRVLYLGTDETWRWRDRLGERVHQTFWLQAFRWGLGARLRGADPRLRVAVDRVLVEPGEPIDVRARVYSEDGTPVDAPVQVRVESLSDGGASPSGDRRIELAGQSGDALARRATVSGLTEGRWRLTFTTESPGLQDVAEVREVFVQRQPGQEGVELSADPAALQRLTAAGGGRTVALAGVRDLLDESRPLLRPHEYASLKTYSLWDGYPVLALIVGLLTVEWLLRKRQGLP